jgi:hypothetical protein
MKARDLVHMSREELWSLPDGKLTLTFDDGKVETTTRRTIFCAYLWSIHRAYPKTPLLKHHHMGMERLTGQTSLTLLSKIYRDWFYSHLDDSTVSREDVWRLMYDTTNEIYNDFIQRCDSYVSTMSILDFVDVLDSPEIYEANTSVVATQKSIDATYDAIKHALDTDKNLSGNAIAEASRSKMLDIKQISQCIGPRGYVTEIDSTIYKQPITVGYATGMRKLYDSMIESRSAAKALMFAKDPLAKCEYFNRKMQLVAQVVETLVPGDCGSQHHMPWTVESSELEMMEGIHYVENGQVKAISARDNHLIGQTLNLRTPFGCVLNDRQSICEVCYGETGYSLPYGTVVGHVAAISIGEKTSQLVLSTKHVDGSSKVDDIQLGETYAEYLVTGAEDNVLRLNTNLKGKKIKIVISAENAKSLPDIYRINNLDDINVARITEMKDVTFKIGDENDEDGMYEITVPVSMGSRLGSLTPEMLYYVKEYGTTLDEKGDYIIDLENWDIGLSMFELPLKHINMLDFQDQVESVIFSVDKKNGLHKFDDPTEAIKSLLALVTSKLKINLSHIMTMAYSVSCVDAKNNDFRLPRGGEDFGFVTLNEIMVNRSLGAMMAFEQQNKAFLRPETFIVKDPPRHPMDSMLMG